MYPVLTGLVCTYVHFNNGAELCRLLASYPILTRMWLNDLASETTDHSHQQLEKLPVLHSYAQTKIPEMGG